MIRLSMPEHVEWRSRRENQVRHRDSVARSRQSARGRRASASFLSDGDHPRLQGLDADAVRSPVAASAGSRLLCQQQRRTFGMDRLQRNLRPNLRQVRRRRRHDQKVLQRVFLNWLLIWFPLWNTIGTDWRLTGSIRRTWHTTPTICISRRRTGREIRPALPFSTSRRLASARVSRQPYSISGSYSPPPRHPRRPPRPPPPFCRHRRWITSGSCRWSWLRAASLVGDSFLPPYSCCSSFSLQVQQVKKNKEKGIKTWNGRKKKKND